MLIYGERAPEKVELRTDSDILISLAHADLYSIDPSIAGSLRVHACEDRNQGGLSSSVGPEKAEDLLVLDHQTQRLKGNIVFSSIASLILLGQLLNDQIMAIRRHLSHTALRLPHRIVNIALHSGILAFHLNLILRINQLLPLILLLPQTFTESLHIAHQTRFLGHPIFLLDSIIEPDREEEDQEPTVQDYNAFCGLAADVGD